MKIEGLYERTIYYDTHTGYSVFSIKLPEYDETGEIFMICDGNVIKYAPGTPLCINGEAGITDRGRIFHVQSVSLNIRTKQLLKLYILSCLPLGMGQAAADRLTHFFISNSLNVEDFINMPERYDILMTVEGMTAAKSNALLKKMSDSTDHMTLLNELSPYGLNYRQTEKLYSLYGGRCMKEIKENPYRAMKKADIPFENADYYAMTNGFSYTDDRRVAAMTTYMFYAMGNTGNCYMHFDEVMQFFRKVEKKISRYAEKIPDAIIMIELARNKAGYIEHGQILKFYSRSAWNTENDIVRNLKRLNGNNEELLNREHISGYIKEKARHLDDIQQTALYLFENRKPSFLIGGPGTGKTTVIKEIVECCHAWNPEIKIRLCAPTGRAAERIKEATGYNAVTIHMLLEYCSLSGENRVMRNALNPLDADILVIDEFSLVGIYLFKMILQALPTGTKLLMVGDWNQLPSIEPGFLLHDLVKSGCFKYVFLNRIHRQALMNPIVINSKKIADSKAHVSDLVQNDAFRIMGFESNEDMKEYLKKIYGQEINSPTFVNDFHVITPMRRGGCGTAEINRLAQSIFHDEAEPHISRGEDMFFFGEKVMTVRNNYESPSYFNGDIWVIDDFKENENIFLKNEDKTTTVSGDNPEDMEHAYAITIHKCQGSEAKEIIILLPEGIHPQMITRSILFTAITRAKESLTILYVGDTLEKFLQSEMHYLRRDGIIAKLTS